MAYSDTDKEQILQSIFDLIGSGLSLRKALKSANPKIDGTTFYQWIDENEDKSKQYARACEERAEALADEIIDIADFAENDTITTEKGDMPDNEWINRSKLRVDTRKWLMSKMMPKKYGDKVDVTSDNKPIAPAALNITIVPPTED